MTATLSIASGLLFAAGCVTTSNLQSASQSLEDRTQALHDELRRDRADEDLVYDADALADAAADFQRAVDRRAPREELDDRFERVAGPYHHLREYYDDRDRDNDRDEYADHDHDRDRDDRRAHDHDRDHDRDHDHDNDGLDADERFRAVTDAYLEVEGALKYRVAGRG
jgi:hypothetical protein